MNAQDRTQAQSAGLARAHRSALPAAVTGIASVLFLLTGWAGEAFAADADCGLRMFDGTATTIIACEPSGTVTSPLRIWKPSQTWGILLVDPADVSASKLRINTSAGVKAWKRLAPTANAATSITATSFTANWTSVNGAVDYRLDVSTASTFTTFVTGYNNKTVAGTSDSVTGLTGSTTYYYRVRSVNASGTSANSNTVTVTTPSALYTFTGVAANLATSSLTGWTQCYLGTYSVAMTPTVVTNILNTDCPKANLLLACRQTGSSTLTLAAHAPRGGVTFDTGTSATATNLANDVKWYFRNVSGEAWGFVDSASTPNNNSCDTNTGGQRVCWHIDAVGGYRCGATTSLNSSTAWERVVYHAD